jgi:flagellar secretion chaperone FliS
MTNKDNDALSNGDTSMNSSAQLALNEYKNASNSAVAYSDPHSLITQMLDGSLTRIAQAKGAMERGQTAVKAELIGKAIMLVGGLEGCLDHEKGGDLAANLSSLYEYMTITLTQANLHNDVEKLDEVTRLMLQIKSAWVAIPEEIRSQYS